MAVIVVQHVILDADHPPLIPRAPGGIALHQMGVMGAQGCRAAICFGG
jgi:hypothetical protein